MNGFKITELATISLYQIHFNIMKSLHEYILEKSWDKYITSTYDDIDKNTVYDYVSGYTVGVNDYLRKGILKGSKNVIKTLDNAFKSKYVSKGKLDVYRTITWEYLENIYGCNQQNIDKFIGKKFTNKGYMSTTKLFKSPWGCGWTSDELVLHIVSKKEIEYLDINKIFSPEEIDCEDQEEILLKRNTTMVLSSYRNDKNRKIYILEMVI